ncbi:hypothetical protein Tco_0031525 [Tanacetum coccineum]
MPHESPLHSVHSLGRDEGSVSLNELTNLYTSLYKKVGSLENELHQTKKTYSTAITKLILRVKKLEQKVKTTKARRRARIVLSEDEEDVEDSSKQGRKISDIDKDPNISLRKNNLLSLWKTLEVVKRVLVKLVLLYEQFYTAKVSTAAENLVYIRRSAEKKKDKGKGIMTEPEPEKKTKKQLEQERLGHEEAVRLQEQLNEEETQRIARDAEIARQLHEEINKAGQERVVAKDDQAHVIDWSDPAVLRYHALQNRPYSVAEVRKNMCIYLKNQGGFKISFKGMSYEEIKPIFERVWDQNQSFVPMDSEDKEKGSKKKAGGSRKKTLARKRAGEKQSDQSAKRQKTEYEKEKEELKAYLDLVPREEFVWKLNHWILKQIKVQRITRFLVRMLDDFDRQDVMDLHRLVEERYATSRPEGRHSDTERLS